MAQLSVSLNVVDKIDRSLPLPGSTTLAQVRAGFERHVPSMADALLVVSYRISQTDSALYELGIRTGDIFTLVTDEVPASEGLGLNVMRPGIQVLEVSDNATAHDILHGLAKLIKKQVKQLYIGRYTAHLDQTLDDYGLEKGDLISMALLPTHVNYQLRLIPARGAFTPFRVKGTTAVLGGSEETIDITHILPRRKRHLIQGAQAEFVCIDDVWHVQALPTANMPMFVDGRRLFPRRPMALFENNVISLGSSPDDPLLQLVVQFDME